jgi:hypothetical protein
MECVSDVRSKQRNFEESKKRFLRVCTHKDVTKVLLHHDNMRPQHAYSRVHHEASVGSSASSTFLPGFGSFRLPSFRSLEGAIPRKKFEDDEEVIFKVKSWL